MKSSSLDALAYPHLHTYLAALPAGLISHPQIKTRGRFSNILREKLSDVLRPGVLPPTLRLGLAHPCADDEWLLCSVYCALSALAHDTIWRSENEYHAGMFDIAKSMYSSTFHKALFFLMSPSLVVMGAARRWDNVYQGTKLSVEQQGKTHALLALEAPKNLFDDCSLRSIGAGFCAAIFVSGGKDPMCKTQFASDGRVTFSLTWQP